MSNVLNDVFKVLPYKITKKISKTGEARSGADIYKRRNNRSYRGLMQYTTWRKLKTGEITPDILDEYTSGCLVMISPREYFGNSYPNRSDYLLREFELGRTGFVYYNNIDEYNQFPPLEEWREVYEISTKGKKDNDDSWVGEYCLNIRNSIPKRISEICKDKEAKMGIDELIETLKSYGIDVSNTSKLPQQCGIGNYDYDFANETMIENVKLQMLYLIMTCEDIEGIGFRNYLKNNYPKFLDKKHDSYFSKIITSEHYDSLYKEKLDLLKNECEKRDLLDFVKLQKVNAWSLKLHRPICPLCSKPMNASNFFEEILQAEGRQVQDNTQREIVLMHISALRPGKLNHRVYNLGWGHNFCNSIQGDKNIDETIAALEEIIENYKKGVNIEG